MNELGCSTGGAFRAQSASKHIAAVRSSYGLLSGTTVNHRVEAGRQRGSQKTFSPGPHSSFTEISNAVAARDALL